MYRIYWTNFFYFSGQEFKTAEDAKTYGFTRGGFEFSVIDPQGNVIGWGSPLYGWHHLD